MFAYLGNVTGLEVLFIVLLTILPFIIGVWIAIAIFRYLRKH